MRCTSYEKDVLYQWNILQTDLADSVRERQLLAGIKAARSTRYYAKKYKKKKKKKVMHHFLAYAITGREMSVVAIQTSRA